MVSLAVPALASPTPTLNSGLSGWRLALHTWILCRRNWPLEGAGELQAALCFHLRGRLLFVKNYAGEGRWQLLSDDRGASVPVGASCCLPRGDETCGGPGWMVIWPSVMLRHLGLQVSPESAALQRGWGQVPPQGQQGRPPGTVTWASRVEGQGRGLGMPPTRAQVLRYTLWKEGAGHRKEETSSYLRAWWNIPLE